MRKQQTLRRCREEPGARVEIMVQKLFQWARNALLVMIVVLLVGAVSGTAWYYYDSRHAKSPVSGGKPSTLTSAPSSARPVAASRPGSSGSTADPTTRVSVQIAVQPGDQFREDVKDALVKELVAVYPQVSAVNWRGDGQDPGYQDSVLKFLNAAETAAPGQQPSMLLAADFMLDPLRCPEQQQDKCEQLRNRLAEYKLTFPYSHPGGGSYYRHDLLWRIWKEYPSTEWGERAFVLLLLSGWDTSGSCARGADQFRAVIHQAEPFLTEHAGSPNQALITNLLGQAYSTWWSLSMGAGKEDRIDPTSFKPGAEEARLKAVEYFEKVLVLAPRGSLADYSRQVLSPLRNRQLTTLGYQSFCSNKE